MLYIYSYIHIIYIYMLWLVLFLPTAMIVFSSLIHFRYGCYIPVTEKLLFFGEATFQTKFRDILKSSALK